MQSEMHSGINVQSCSKATSRENGLSHHEASPSVDQHHKYRSKSLNSWHKMTNCKIEQIKMTWTHRVLPAIQRTSLEVYKVMLHSRLRSTMYYRIAVEHVTQTQKMTCYQYVITINYVLKAVVTIGVHGTIGVPT